MTVCEKIVEGLKKACRACRSSPSLVVVVAMIGMFLDGMLMTAVAPILPNILRDHQVHHVEAKRLTTTTASPRGTNATLSYLDNYEHLDSYGRPKAAEKELKPETHEDDDERAIMWQIALESYTAKSKYYSLPSQRDLPSTLNDSAAANISLGTFDNGLSLSLLFASKDAVQLLVSPVIGPLTNKIGYTCPMLFGFIVLCVSTTVFAFGVNYWMFLGARAVQGIGSSCTTICGLGMVTTLYTEDKERSCAVGIAMTGLTFGLTIGPPYGGVMYQFIGQAPPFLILSGVAVIGAFLHVLSQSPKVVKEEQTGSSIGELICDPYILIAVGALIVALTPLSILDPTLPLHLRQTMHTPPWQQGLIFLPPGVFSVVASILYGPLLFSAPRWLVAAISILICVGCTIAVPFANVIWELVFPLSGLGLFIGFVDLAMVMTIAYVVDIRHVPVYGSAYALANIAFCLAYSAGPAIGGALMYVLSFQWMMWVTAIVLFVYTPLTLLLRAPPAKDKKHEEAKSLVDEKPQQSYDTMASTGDDQPKKSDDLTAGLTKPE